MSVAFSWHVPTGGDGPAMLDRAERLPRIAYLTTVARVAELAGFDRVLVPCSFSAGRDGPNVDSYTLGVACLGATSSLRVVLAHRPGFINPAVFAHMCATADEMSGGRLALNIVTAGAPGDMEQVGDVLDHDARYRRAGEFVDVLRAVWTQAEADYEGDFYRLCDARIRALPVQRSGPEIHLAGSSPAALDMAVRQADVYMTAAGSLDDVRERIAEVRDRGATIGRSPRFCVAAMVFAAATDLDALRRAHHATGCADLEVATVGGGSWVTANGHRAAAWSGLTVPAHGAAWIGCYERLAELICAFADAGVTDFQLFGPPYLEQAMHIGERLLPVVRSQLGAPVST